MNASSSTVAIIGAGYAGMAAAVALARSGIRCHVYETAKEAGGRARRIHYRGSAIDNGQHILIGAYRELLDLIRLVGVPDSHLARMPLTMKMHPGFELRAPRLPAPLNLGWALLRAKGLSARERVAAVRFADAMKRTVVADHENVLALLHSHGQTEPLITNLWAPLCIAALNTPLERASAKVFVTVLRDALFRARADSDFVLPKVDLTALFPEPAARWLETQGSIVECSTRVTSIEQTEYGFRIGAKGESRPHAAIVCAVGPHQLDAIESTSPEVRAALNPARPTRFEPIYTVYLQYPASVALPEPMLGRQHGMSQWFFDRGALCGQAGLIAAVISASGQHESLSHDEVAQAAHRELVDVAGPLPQPEWHKVIAEQFATFACEPGVARPNPVTRIPGLFLAGDYTEGPYPSTLEGAARSGSRAASLITHHLKQ
jgi:hydroxysqualene dehydroxylase